MKMINETTSRIDRFVLTLLKVSHLFPFLAAWIGCHEHILAPDRRNHASEHQEYEEACDHSPFILGLTVFFFSLPIQDS